MSKVSRSVYQKLKEENNRLTKDLRAITMDFDKKVFRKYRDKFTEDDKFHSLLKIVCSQYLKKHPELDIMNPNFKSLTS